MTSLSTASEMFLGWNSDGLVSPLDSIVPGSDYVVTFMDHSMAAMAHSSIADEITVLSVDLLMSKMTGVEESEEDDARLL